MREGWAVVCDFDGTALTEDLGDAVSQHFAGHATWRRAEDEYRDGAFSFGELLRRIFEPITASAVEIGDFAREQAGINEQACQRHRTIPLFLGQKMAGGLYNHAG